jgi:DNA polymerase-1
MQLLLEELQQQNASLIWFNGIFDLAFLYASGHDLSKFNHIDAMHLWKWAKNSQFTEMGTHSWSLAAAAGYWLKDLPWAEDFIEMKKAGHNIEAGQDAAYWTARAGLDAYATVLVGQRAWNELNKKQQNSAVIEGMCLWPNAKSWFNGVRVDVARCNELSEPIKIEMRQLEIKLGVENAAVTLSTGIDTWTPSKILRSPKQLATLLYETWGFTCKAFTPKGAPATDKAALTYLADDHEQVLDLMRWRELNTQVTKFIGTPQDAAKYLNSTYLHPAPKVFSTYTGRMTYTGKIKNKFKTGCALHQWPRSKELRKLILPPPGKKLVEFDASGQENRFMAIMAREATMTTIFQNNMDIHSYMGAQLAGIPYDAFMKLKAEGAERVVGSSGYRYQGKFNNLSNQYRIGAKKQRIQARVQYGMIVDFMTVVDWQRSYHATYPGVRQYWKDSIRRAQEVGYAETLGGRRFYLSMWSGDRKWGTESSAINTPIQGTGADMKELGVAILTRTYPDEFEYAFDLHDALFGYVDEDMPDSRLLDMRKTLDDLPYKEVWGFEPPIPLPWDCQVGPNWGEMREL